MSFEIILGVGAVGGAVAGSFLILSAAYGVVLVVGLSSLESPRQPIGDPLFPAAR